MCCKDFFLSTKCDIIYYFFVVDIFYVYIIIVMPTCLVAGRRFSVERFDEVAKAIFDLLNCKAFKMISIRKKTRNVLRKS